jgi:hypothetical protein
MSTGVRTARLWHLSHQAALAQFQKFSRFYTLLNVGHSFIWLEGN